MQKLADAPLSTCPQCGAESYTKQVTAAGFALKGSGWYATDFKGGAKPAEKAGDKPADKSGEKKEAAPAHTCGSGGCGACS
jgi:predicted nucleic acid-binding Zn ribbon protein